MNRVALWGGLFLAVVAGAATPRAVNVAGVNIRSEADAVREVEAQLVFLL